MTSEEEEKILGMFPGWLHKGIIKGLTCVLVFTNQRLVVAKERRLGGALFLKSPYYNFLLAKARDRLKVKRMSPEDMFEENPENFDIPYSEIAALETSESSKAGGGALHPRLDVFIDDLDKPKFRFEVCIRNRYSEGFEEFLREILPEKV
jgi:hypothetical protein